MKKRNVCIGSHVVYTAETAELFGLDSNRIYEVRDCCLGGTGYTFSLAPVTEPPALNCTRTGVFPRDLRVVGE